MSWMTAEPGQVSSVGTHQADALAGARRRHGEHVLGAVVAQIAAVVEAEHDALVAEQAGVAHIGHSPPSGPSHRSWLGSCGSARQAAPPMATAPLAMPPSAATAPARANTSGACASNASHQANSFQGA